MSAFPQALRNRPRKPFICISADKLDLILRETANEARKTPEAAYWPHWYETQIEPLAIYKCRRDGQEFDAFVGINKDDETYLEHLLKNADENSTDFVRHHEYSRFTPLAFLDFLRSFRSRIRSAIRGF